MTFSFSLPSTKTQMSAPITPVLPATLFYYQHNDLDVLLMNLISLQVHTVQQMNVSSGFKALWNVSFVGHMHSCASLDTL